MECWSDALWLNCTLRMRHNIRRKPWSVPRFRLRQAYSATGSEAVVSKAKDRADSPLCCSLGRKEAQVLT
jgi:hypothetical protein